MHGHPLRKYKDTVRSLFALDLSSHRGQSCLNSCPGCAGTPVQNKLDELWSLLNFLMPALFGSAEDFQHWFGVDCHLDEEEVLLVTSRLHQILRPFMLRRLKETVACELPSKASNKADS